MFTPDSVVVPLPAFEKAPSPEITPENVVLALFNPPAVKVTPEAKSMSPDPDIEPISSVASTSNVAPLLTLKAVFASEPVTFNVPADNDVAPS